MANITPRAFAANYVVLLLALHYAVNEIARCPVTEDARFWTAENQTPLLSTPKMVKTIIMVTHNI